MRYNRNFPTSQQNSVPRVNWSNPITRGLVSLFPLGPEDLGTRDIVKNLLVTRTAPSPFIPTPSKNGIFLAHQSGSRLDFTPPDGVTSTTPVTFCWIQEGRLVSGDSTVLSWKAPGATYSFLIYQHASNAAYYFVVGVRNSSSQISFGAATGPLTNFKSNTFVLVLENGMDSKVGVRLWRDGVELAGVDPGAGSNFAQSTVAVAKIGNLSGNNSGFDGLLGNVGIFNRALTPAEAASLSSNTWQLYESDRTDWIPTSVAGTITVNSDKALSYAIRELISKDSAQSYFIRTFAQSDKALSYNIRTSASSDKAISYDIRSLAQSDKALSYVVRGLTLSDKSLSYDIRTVLSSDKSLSYLVRTSAQKDSSQSYFIRTFAQSDKSLTYDILSATNVISSILISYDIRTKAESDKSLTYNIRTFVNSDLGLEYLIRLLLSKDLDIDYLIRLLTSKDSNLSYAIRASVQKDRSISYDIQGILQVFKDLNLQYSILEDVASDAVIVYLGVNPTITIKIDSNSAVSVIVK